MTATTTMRAGSPPRWWVFALSSCALHAALLPWLLAALERMSHQPNRDATTIELTVQPGAPHNINPSLTAVSGIAQAVPRTASAQPPAAIAPLHDAHAAELATPAPIAVPRTTPAEVAAGTAAGPADGGAVAVVTAAANTASVTPAQSASDSAPRREPDTTEVLAHLRATIERNDTYPLMARRRGWEGEVLLDFHVAQHGDIERVRVARSSGNRLLDQSAIRALQRIRRIAPELWIDGYSTRLQLSVVYRLIGS